MIKIFLLNPTEQIFEEVGQKLIDATRPNAMKALGGEALRLDQRWRSSSG